MRTINLENLIKGQHIVIYKDGSQWCALVGGNLQEGDAGFGETIAEALSQLESYLA